MYGNLMFGSLVLQGEMSYEWDISLFQIKRHHTSANVDDDIENYDYENANDRDNYCPLDAVSVKQEIVDCVQTMPLVVISISFYGSIKS